MSNTGKAPTVQATLQNPDRDMGDAHYATVYRPDSEQGQAYQRLLKMSKDTKVIATTLSKLGMAVRNPFKLPLEATADRNAVNTGVAPFALAALDRPTFRARTLVAHEVMTAGYRLLPAAERERVRAKTLDNSLISAGVPWTFGRLEKYYPKPGSHIAKPITKAEAERELLYELGPHFKTRETFEAAVPPVDRLYLPFFPEEGTRGVLINERSGNGFPVLSKGNDPAAKELYQPLALEIRKEIVAAWESDKTDGVWNWVREAERTRPHLVTLQGKCKSDYYSEAKLAQRQLRFYNVLGRQITIPLQACTQQVERSARSFAAGGGCKSASGFSMVRGGFSAFATYMDRELDRFGRAHTRMGDDTACAIEVLHTPPGATEPVAMGMKCALDASSFDLTQHQELTKEVHAELRRANSYVDAPAAQLLYALQRQRQVVMAGRDVRELRHGGPSGLPMQSKVNGMVMGVATDRVFDEIDRQTAMDIPMTEELVNDIISKVGRDMGLTIKLEQCSFFSLEHALPFTQSLRDVPFLYLGYWVRLTPHGDIEEVTGHVDNPRSMSQARYPSSAYVDDKSELLILESARLASTFISMGLPPPEFAACYAELRKQAESLLLARIAVHGDIVSPAFRWLVRQDVAAEDPDDDPRQNPVGVSLKGLLGALMRDPRELWAAPLPPTEEPSAATRLLWQAERVELPYTGLATGASHSAIPVDRIMGTLFLEEGLVHSMPLVTPNMGFAKGLVKRVPATRAPSIRTAGRNPTTKVFAPALPPRDPRVRLHENAGWLRDEARTEAAAFFDAAERVEEEEQAEATLRQFQHSPHEKADSDWGSEMDDNEAEAFFGRRMVAAKSGGPLFSFGSFDDVTPL